MIDLAFERVDLVYRSARSARIAGENAGQIALALRTVRRTGSPVNVRALERGVEDEDRARQSAYRAMVRARRSSSLRR